ncbi:MAG: 2-octaprenyl-6-methoxyphenyl hydroxylase [Legionellales bacterium]|nr:2-octaprenyl-6-methoxyphenyl hydroxylase [Legionellales bacterium]
MNDFDIVIVGGSYIGASLACALANLPLKIAVLEARDYAIKMTPANDRRITALSLSSQRIFSSINAWEELNQYASPIRHIHISQAGHFGKISLNANEVALPAFGYVIANDYFMQILHQKMLSQKNVTLFTHASVQDLKIDEHCANLIIKKNDQLDALRAKLIIAADGTQSFIRQTLNIPTTTIDYHENAIVANVGLNQFHNAAAYERFTHQGPLALLPWQEQQMALVFTVKRQECDQYFNLPDHEFLTILQQRFGYRVGRFTWIGKRQAFPLQCIQSQQHIAKRVALIGNAAQTLHPIAAQGFNLGLRDCAWLADSIAQAVKNQNEIGNEAMLNQYEKSRVNDQQHFVKATDTLATLFLSDCLPLNIVRNFGVLSADILPLVRKKIIQFGLGETQILPPLALGIPLEQLA